ncbi:hypothetical protein FRB97_003556 [Tulasnella sp. 331]|nr:hypothetical protein FRB97_003556 [Tulasnella sp. 331]
MPRQQTLDEMLNGSSSSPQKGKAKSVQVLRRVRGPSTSSATRTAQVSLPRESVRRKQSPIPSDDSDLSDNDSDIRDIDFEKPQAIQDDSESELAPLSPQWRKDKLSQRQRAPETPPSSDSGSKLSDGSEDDLVPLTKLVARKGKKRALAESDDEAERPTRRRLVRGKARRHSSEDDDDPLDGVESERIIEKRLRGPSKQSVFSNKLEALKKRRKGITPTPGPEIIEDSSEESSGAEDDPSGPFRLARPDGEDLPDVEIEEVDDSFIVEDDEDLAIELPAQYSRQSHQDLSIHFKVVCQLFVHLAVEEPDDRESFMRKAGGREYFTVSLNALERKLGAIKDSLVRSSVWKENFTKALNTFPEFELSDLSTVVPQCDACHIGGRLSKFLGRVSGSPYSKASFQHDEQDSESEDDGSETESVNGKEFHLGRFCAQRARVYHRFTHWQYALFEALRTEVDALHERNSNKGSLKILWGARIEKPQDVHKADEVMQWLDDRGIIQAEWIKVKKLMETAHHLDPQRGGMIDD